MRGAPALAAVAILAAGCGDTDPVVIEPAGSADYVFENQTSSALTVAWTLSPSLGNQKGSAGPVAPGGSIALVSDSIIGVNPRPPDTFASVRLLDDGVPVLVQAPVASASWQVDVVTAGAHGYGHAIITLRATDADLAPDRGLPAGQCCCSYIVEGDIVVEDVQAVDACETLDVGTCTIVDRNRTTPHPCCPNATGPRCGPQG